MKCQSCGGGNDWRRTNCSYCYAPTKRNTKIVLVAAAAFGVFLGALMFLDRATS